MRYRLFSYALAALVLCFLPEIVSSYYLGLATKMLIFALFAMSLDLIMGYAGLASLGHAAFFGLGAYTVGLLVAKAHISHWLAFPAGVLMAAACGTLFAFLCLRARGSYLLMITLALAQVVWGIAFGWRTLTNGDDGLPVTSRPDFFVSLSGNVPFYYFVLLIFGLSAVTLALIVASPYGYALRGIRESETRMRALGFDVWRHQMAAFVIASAFAGLAGCLYVYDNKFVSTDFLYVTNSAEALIMVILGGVGTLVGPVLGAGVIIFLEDAISSQTRHWLLVLGIIYVATTMIAPRGLVGMFQSLITRRPTK